MKKTLTIDTIPKQSLQLTFIRDSLKNSRGNKIIHFFMVLICSIIFSTNSFSQIHEPVNLGTAGNFVILAKSGISSIPPSEVTGDIGVSPIDQTAITGFSLTIDPSNVYSTSTQVAGKVFAADYAAPTPVNLTTAVGDMESAYNNAAGRTNPDFTELGAGEIGGLTLVPGLYKWSTDVLITNDVTINGGPNDIWIFQIAGGITIANGKKVILSGGAQSKNIFWQSAGIVSVGTTAKLIGIVLAQTSINLSTGATVDGLLLAQTAVTLDANKIKRPSEVTGVGTEFIPGKFILYQNYPNPFNPSTTIQYSIGKAGIVLLRIYSLLGFEVTTLVDEYHEPGIYSVTFNTNKLSHSLSSGVYFYRLEIGAFVSMKKLILLK